MGYIGGLLSGIQKLSPKSAVVNTGDYNVVVVSSRVTDLSPEERTPNGVDFLSLRSNPIRLHIVPPPEAWQRAKLTQSVTGIDAHPQTPGVEPPELKAAIADLRFLGTPAAARVLAQHLRDDEPALM